MVDGAPAIFVALEESGFASAIRRSTWLYPAANVAHIVSLVCLAGAVTVMDLRLLGALSASDPALLLRRARACAIAALAAMALTGLMLFSAEASHLATNRVFQLKLVLIVAALGNVALYELLARREVEALRVGALMPARVRIAGLLSLALWIAVAACGRSIAYF